MKPGVDYVGVCTPFFCHDGQGNFLLHKRSDKCKDEHFKWDFGAGTLEHGQTFAENVLREVKEEYGCDGVITERFPVEESIRDYNGILRHWVMACFVVQVDPKQAKRMEPEFSLELGWFRLNNLPDPLHKAIPPILEKYAQVFDKYR